MARPTTTIQTSSEPSFLLSTTSIATTTPTPVAYHTPRQPSPRRLRKARPPSQPAPAPAPPSTTPSPSDSPRPSLSSDSDRNPSPSNTTPAHSNVPFSFTSAVALLPPVYCRPSADLPAVAVAVSPSPFPTAPRPTTTYEPQETLLHDPDYFVGAASDSVSFDDQIPLSEIVKKSRHRRLHDHSRRRSLLRDRSEDSLPSSSTSSLRSPSPGPSLPSVLPSLVVTQPTPTQQRTTTGKAKEHPHHPLLSPSQLFSARVRDSWSSLRLHHTPRPAVHRDADSDSEIICSPSEQVLQRLERANASPSYPHSRSPSPVDPIRPSLLRNSHSGSRIPRPYRDDDGDYHHCSFTSAAPNDLPSPSPLSDPSPTSVRVDSTASTVTGLGVPASSNNMLPAPLGTSYAAQDAPHSRPSAASSSFAPRHCLPGPSPSSSPNYSPPTSLTALAPPPTHHHTHERTHRTRPAADLSPSPDRDSCYTVGSDHPPLKIFKPGDFARKSTGPGGRAHRNTPSPSPRSPTTLARPPWNGDVDDAGAVVVTSLADGDDHGHTSDRPHSHPYTSAPLAGHTPNQDEPQNKQVLPPALPTSPSSAPGVGEYPRRASDPTIDARSALPRGTRLAADENRRREEQLSKLERLLGTGARAAAIAQRSKADAVGYADERRSSGASISTPTSPSLGFSALADSSFIDLGGVVVVQPPPAASDDDVGSSTSQLVTDRWADAFHARPEAHRGHHHQSQSPHHHHLRHHHDLHPRMRSISVSSLSDISSALSARSSISSRSRLSINSSAPLLDVPADLASSAIVGASMGDELTPTPLDKVKGLPPTTNEMSLQDRRNMIKRARKLAHVLGEEVYNEDGDDHPDIPSHPSSSPTSSAAGVPAASKPVARLVRQNSTSRGGNGPSPTTTHLISMSAGANGQSGALGGKAKNLLGKAKKGTTETGAVGALNVPVAPPVGISQKAAALLGLAITPPTDPAAAVDDPFQERRGRSLDVDYLSFSSGDEGRWSVSTTGGGADDEGRADVFDEAEVVDPWRGGNSFDDVDAAPGRRPTEEEESSPTSTVHAGRGTEPPAGAARSTLSITVPDSSTPPGRPSSFLEASTPTTARAGHAFVSGFFGDEDEDAVGEDEDDGKRRADRRRKVAKVTRWLGENVPVELVLPGGVGGSCAAEGSTAPGGGVVGRGLERFKSLRRTNNLPPSSSSCALDPVAADSSGGGGGGGGRDAWLNSENIDPKQRLADVRRANKLERVFGQAPPSDLYRGTTCSARPRAAHAHSVSVPVAALALPSNATGHQQADHRMSTGSNTTTTSSSSDSYRKSIASLKYLLDYDRDKLADLMSTYAEEEGEGESGGEEEDEDQGGSSRLAAALGGEKHDYGLRDGSDEKRRSRSRDPPPAQSIQINRRLSQRSASSLSLSSSYPPSPTSPTVTAYLRQHHPSPMTLHAQRAKRTAKLSKFFGREEDVFAAMLDSFEREAREDESLGESELQEVVDRLRQLKNRRGELVGLKSGSSRR